MDFLIGYSSTPIPPNIGPPDVTLVGRITGPEPGYVATPKLFVKCALTMLRSRDGQEMTRGVLTPAVLFRDVRLLDEMKAEGWLGWSVVEA